jgi:hypothetical protein
MPHIERGMSIAQQKSHAFLLSTLRCAGRKRSVSGQERGIRSGLASSHRLSRLLFRSTEARTPHRSNRCRFFWEANHGLTKDFKPLPDTPSTAIRALRAGVGICRRVRKVRDPGSYLSSAATRNSVTLSFNSVLRNNCSWQLPQTGCRILFDRGTNKRSRREIWNIIA